MGIEKMSSLISAGRAICGHPDIGFGAFRGRAGARKLEADCVFIGNIERSFSPRSTLLNRSVGRSNPTAITAEEKLEHILDAAIDKNLFPGRAWDEWPIEKST